MSIHFASQKRRDENEDVWTITLPRTNNDLREAIKLCGGPTCNVVYHQDIQHQNPMNIPLVAAEIVARDQHQQSTINRISLVESILREHQGDYNGKRYQEGKMAGVRIAANHLWLRNREAEAQWLVALAEDLGE